MIGDNKGTTAMSVSMPAEIVEEIVKAEIVRNLGETSDIVRGLIERAAKEPCQCSDHRYGSKVTRVGCELERKIVETCKRIVSKWVEENREQFEKALLVEMAKPGRMKALVGAFAAGIRGGTWGVDVKLKMREGEP